MLMKDSGAQHRCWRMKGRTPVIGRSFFRRGKFCGDCAAMTSPWTCARPSTSYSTRSRARSEDGNAREVAFLINKLRQLELMWIESPGGATREDSPDRSS